MTPLLEVDREIFQAYFDRKPFHVRHALSGHPLFELPRLLELSRELPCSHPSTRAYPARMSSAISLSDSKYGLPQRPPSAS